MKNFLQKHILFPKDEGFMPYVYLVFMLPAVVLAIMLPLFQKIIFILLILLFLKAYRDGFWNTKYHPLQIAIQLVIVFFLSVNPWFPYYGLQIFTGFEIGFSTVSSKLYKRYLWAYYLLAPITLVFPLFQAYQENYPNTIVWIAVSFFFMLGCVPFARSIMKTYSLKSENKALMQQVRDLERERIAYDLHDNLGQTFSTITLKAELAEKLLEKNKISQSKKEISEIVQLSRNSLTLVRQIVSGMKPIAIRQVLHEKEKDLQLAGVKLKTKNLSLTEDWSQACQNATSAVLKEALTNVIHHAHAGEVQVNVEPTGFTVIDNGVGLGDAEASHGIASMRRRIEEVGGRFQVKSENGVRIEVNFGNN
ncbi:MAG: sensor histidine kinase [Streptococcaceae bacterium]|jgi:two-component system sensor histidine kinase DesK|nr:sensor histidine kinase [Streptococcaceae bacterium]